MRFKNIFLVSPPSSSRYGALRVPAGLGYVAQALQDNFIEYECVDMRLGYDFDYLKKECLIKNIGIKSKKDKLFNEKENGFKFSSKSLR